MQIAGAHAKRTGLLVKLVGALVLNLRFRTMVIEKLNASKKHSRRGVADDKNRAQRGGTPTRMGCRRESGSSYSRCENQVGAFRITSVEVGFDGVPLNSRR